MKRAEVADLVMQMKITNRLLAAQLRGSMGQKELVGLLVSTGGTYAGIADVLDTTPATVEVTARRIRNEKRAKARKRNR